MTTPEEWAEAREAFEAGDSARSIARRLDVAHSTVVRRAAREGWSVRTGEEGGARTHRRVAAHPDAPLEEEPPARHDLPALDAGDSSPPVIDWSNPRHAAAVIAAAHGHKPPAEREAWLEQRAREQLEERAERLGLRPPGYWRRCPF